MAEAAAAYAVLPRRSASRRWSSRSRVAGRGVAPRRRNSRTI